jgi:dTDP-6-deoxy-L-talose 4-dehydrogenase (NAD+)
MARVLITGGTGFIGSALVRRLAAAGDEVLVLHREGSDLTRLAPVRDVIRTGTVDLADVASWRPLVHDFGPERVFHCAWYAEPGKYLTDAEQNHGCLQASTTFVQELLALRPRHFVTVGTCFEYDTEHPGPLREDSTPERPQHVYSRSKLALKQRALQLAEPAGVPLVHARVFYLYGPFEDARRLVPFVLGKLQKGEPVQLRSHGRQVRDFLHVDDVAQGLDAAAKLGRPGVVNIASGKGITVRDLALGFADSLGRRELVSFAPDDTPLPEPMSVVGDAERLRGLGFVPRHWPAHGSAHSAPLP